MKAFITSIGEDTTNLCRWSLERNGFDVTVLSGSNSLADKLEKIYNNIDEDFVRIDADVVVNKGCNEQNIRQILRTDYLKDAWWVQFQTYDWFQQNVGYGGVQFIKKEALPILRENISKFKQHERPETELTRSYGMYNPRRFESFDKVMGIHNYKNDMKRVKEVKARRNQLDNYDFELANKLEEL